MVGTLNEESERDFRDMFEAATGFQPFPYQRYIAETGFPDLLNAPTGAGKTAGVVLSWVWRRKFAPREVRETTPRRLVYCLPMRVLVEQTYDNILDWLDRIGLLGGEIAWQAQGERKTLDNYEPKWDTKISQGWALENGAVGSSISVHILMGGDLDVDWDRFPASDSILIGTQDMLLSRALNRGYAMSRFRWPMSFGFLNNDCLWILDEVQLMSAGLPTSLQIDAFRRYMGTYAPTGSLWMSATCEPEWLQTVDRKRPEPGKVFYLKGGDLEEETLRRRVNAKKLLSKHDVKLTGLTSRELKGYIESMKRLVKQSHKASITEDQPPLTLVMVNTVDRAQRLYRALREEIPDHEWLAEQFEYLKEKIRSPASWGEVKRDGQLYKKTKQKLNRYKEELEHTRQKLEQNLPDLILVHSRFRPPEREKIIEVLGQRPDQPGYPSGGRIVISTQVVEAGVDISATTLITELAPWPSLVQRFGRVNRYGEHESSKVIWVDTSTEGKKGEKCSLPYTPEKLELARERLEDLDTVSPRRVRKIDVPRSDRPLHVLRRKDIVELFDTTPDLSGNDIDVSRFIREVVESDVEVFWRDLGKGPPPEDLPRPCREELCSVPIGSFREFSGSAWIWDHVNSKWMQPDTEHIIPGRVFLLPSQAGRYSVDIGWDPESKNPVEPVETTSTTSNESVGDDNYTNAQEWLTLKQHTMDVLSELDNLLNHLSPHLEPNIIASLRIAAHCHDVGKSHPVFQEALLDLVEDEEKELRSRETWAKSGTDKRATYARKHFRHELASALAVLQNEEILAESSDVDLDLVAYLIAAHHGKVRMSIRAFPDEDLPPRAEARSAGEEARFALGVWDGDILPKVDLGDGEYIPETTLNLDPMELGTSYQGSRSWLERTIGLRDRNDLGIFRLGYLESILRVADWRGSQHGARNRGESS